MHQHVFWPSLLQEAEKYLLDTPTPEALEGHNTHVFLFSKESSNTAYYKFYLVTLRLKIILSKDNLQVI